MEKMPLRDAFISRENKFLLLEKGFKKCGYKKDEELLEIGCARGDAAAYLWKNGFTRLTSTDIDEKAIAEAERCHSGCRFLRADACDLPFENESFYGAFSEAAYSVITDKEKASREYRRILKPGGKFLLNDFCLRDQNARGAPETGIPCFQGVRTMDEYREIFENSGFECRYAGEEFPEFIRIAVSLSKIFSVPPGEVGEYILKSYGTDSYVSDFFSGFRLSCCQMIFVRSNE
ncbi:MAG: class I SAM-dependent methyltransferase [Candidatus Limivicinus sp.]|jgi:ubiquinone/menaquinone biosynthesis C-methylase UbiE